MTEEVASKETPNFFEEYLQTNDIDKRIELAQANFKKNTDHWVVAYNANAPRIHEITQSITKKRSDTYDQNKASRTPSNEQDKSVDQVEKPLTPGQRIFIDLNKYSIYYQWEQEILKESNVDADTLDKIHKTEDLYLNIIKNQFYYDHLDENGKDTIDWLIKAAQRGEVMVLTTQDTKSEEERQMVDAMAQKFKTPMMIVPDVDEVQRKHTLVVFPDMLKTEEDSLELLVYLSHERGHVELFKSKPETMENNLDNLLFHEYFAILESKRTYQKLPEVLQLMLPEDTENLYRQNKTRIDFEMPGLADQINFILDDDSHSLFMAYQHSLETMIENEYNKLSLAIIQKDFEAAKKIMAEMPGSQNPVGFGLNRIEK